MMIDKTIELISNETAINTVASHISYNYVFPSLIYLFLFTAIASFFTGMFAIDTKKAKFKFIGIWFFSIILLPLIYLLIVSFIPQINIFVTSFFKDIFS